VRPLPIGAGNKYLGVGPLPGVSSSPSHPGDDKKSVLNQVFSALSVP
jgi:hypothetical protein